MTNEPPAGLKNNMRRCLALEPLNDPAFWEEPAAEQPPESPATRTRDKKVGPLCPLQSICQRRQPRACAMRRWVPYTQRGTPLELPAVRTLGKIAGALWSGGSVKLSIQGSNPSTLVGRCAANPKPVHHRDTGSWLW